ncbi:MAG: hypothetical protein GX181_04350 [Synergistaceae bacterium]|nr:hypothetical protein [Synergistota bacterium]NLM71181.1 hypothetical protein [Synergistaceae bacterium]
MTRKYEFTTPTGFQREVFRIGDRHLGDMFSLCWRGPFEGFSASRKTTVSEPAAFSQTEMRWRGPFEGVR